MLEGLRHGLVSSLGLTACGKLAWLGSTSTARGARRLRSTRLTRRSGVPLASMNFYFWARVAVIAMLLAAVGPWPYDYFTLLRFAVCAVTAFGAYRAHDGARTASTAPRRTKQQRWSWALTFIAFLFNPFVPVHLERGTWTVIDIGVALVLIAEVRSDHRAKRSPGRDTP